MLKVHHARGELADGSDDSDGFSRIRSYAEHFYKLREHERQHEKERKTSYLQNNKPKTILVPKFPSNRHLRVTFLRGGGSKENGLSKIGVKACFPRDTFELKNNECREHDLDSYGRWRGRSICQTAR